jgi:hypothetical protein
MDPFGRQRLTDFFQDPAYINVNHGSYGYTPKAVVAHQRQLYEQAEHNTERWMRIDA